MKDFSWIANQLPWFAMIDDLKPGLVYLVFLPGQMQAQPDFQMWSAMENLPPGSPTPV